MSDYWFRPKRIGWGVTPMTWQGWVATLVVTLLATAIALLAQRFGPAPYPHKWINL